MGRARLSFLLLGLWLMAGCGASEETPAPTPTPDPAPEAEEDPPTEAPDDAPIADVPDDPEPEEPPAPEPIELVAGERIGPIRIGMTEEELTALGLETAEVDPRSTRYGPYRIWLRDGAVRRVEAIIGDLGRIRYGGEVFEAGVDIYTLRDAFEECVWVEGGGERYECAGGHLTVRTTHTMDPQRYTLGVRSR